MEPPLYEVWLLNNRTDAVTELCLMIFPTRSSLDKRMGRSIVHESFNKRKVCPKMVPKLFTPEQKRSRMNILNNIDPDPRLLVTVITYDESWFFTYDPETKRGSG
ncbi:hypothetical protein NQ318_006637 [Aromia moschata]|uniref:Uncharacterized protein n=1 Tax=Aromia moschata TaxID=1265417 RepID=A0AAV8XDZ8_9CUCU|nr:hypothetical protein NQ318_006637 [Aromia moschata]